MSRRIAYCLLAVLFASNTGCCGHVRSFFYRITHCHGCHPGYGYATPAVEAGPVYGGPVYGGGPVGTPGCSSCYAAPAAHAATIVYAPQTGIASPVFGGVPQTMPSGPTVYPSNPTTPEPPMAKPIGSK